MAGTHERKFFENAQTVASILGEEDSGVSVRILKAVAVAAAVCLLAAVIAIGSFLSAGAAQSKIMQQAEDVFALSGGFTASLIDELQAVYPDAVAWLQIPDTKINTAVLQTDNNEFYLNHNQQKQKSRYGAVFMSHSDNIASSSGDKNFVIYGNNMRDGQMFGTLKKYRNVNFYKSNPGFYFYHSGGRDVYAVCAVMLLDSNDNEDFNVGQSYFIGADEFNAWYAQAQSRSILNIGVSAKYGDSFITLVTPASDFSGARLAVLAKRTDSMDVNSIDSSSAVANGETRYPRAWYKQRNMDYPY